MSDIEILTKLLTCEMSRHETLKWMWGEALLGHAMSDLDSLMKTEIFTQFLLRYCEYWSERSVSVDCADRAAPGLITYAIYKKTGSKVCEALTSKVLDYIKNEPRVIGDAVNHLGNSPASRFYPKSVWVDSLMMFGVFAAIYASENSDAELLDYAARQPAFYSSLLQDPCGLWRHSYWVNFKRGHPAGDIFWGRGNGWVLCSLPMILDCIGEGHPEFEPTKEIFRRTALAILPCQRKDGSFRTILNKSSYSELSATALIAAGFIHGVRKQYLDKDFLDPGLLALKAAMGGVWEKGGKLSMHGISAPTIPLHILPALGYRLTPLGKNWSYGIAALAFAVMEKHRIESGI
ncbi:MAG: glycoside hydrolase family 88 protein [Clostridiales bacterium]|jgi:unsaturated rhamnogalacturonyl hydrolase|nr:glycoside hydrolase family 88 protein [Clostridiales bacterium]